jgi:hypothetical protein
MTEWRFAALAALVLGCKPTSDRKQPPAPRAAVPASRDSVCPPLQVIYDTNQAVTPSVQLVFAEPSTDLDFVISNKPRECKEIMASTTPMARDELYARFVIRRDPHALFPDGVSWDNDDRDPKLALSGPGPKVRGDIVSVCLPDTVLHGKSSFGGHSLELRGLVEARYCGVSK